jgi:hypothetical protein
MENKVDQSLQQVTERLAKVEIDLQSHSHAWYDISYKPDYFAPTVAVLASDFNNTTAIPADVIGLSIAVGADETWKFELFGSYQTAATATGAGVTLAAPSGASVNGRIWLRQGDNGTDTYWEAQILSSAENTSSASVIAQNTTYGCGFLILVRNGATAGNVQVRWRSENTVEARLLAGTTLVGTRLV